MIDEQVVHGSRVEVVVSFPTCPIELRSGLFMELGAVELCRSEDIENMLSLVLLISVMCMGLLFHLQVVSNSYFHCHTCKRCSVLYFLHIFFLHMQSHKLF